jgi:hypothetical protein
VTRLRLDDDERDLVLAGLFELRVARAEDEELGEWIVALVERLAVTATRCSSARTRIRSAPRRCRSTPADETDEG